MSDKKHEQHGNGHKKDSHHERHEEPVMKDEKAAEAPVEAEQPIDSAEDLKQQLDAQSDRYLRLMAEFDNFKKRVSRDYERLVESANERLMGELIEVRENLERAVKAGEQCTDVKSMYEGMKLIFTKFNDVLSRNGLEPFGEIGDQFNPELHEAMMKTPNDTVPEDHIGEVFEKGYRLKKRVIRHAKVIVSAGAVKEDKKVDG
jgi:molecular chaperone GrpE